MTKPVRIQRKRTKGFNLQAASPNGLPVVYVGRPTLWSNPFKIGSPVARAGREIFYATDNGMLRAAYKLWLLTEGDGVRVRSMVRNLCGKNLACWCPLDQPCHADVLLELANGWVSDD